MKKLALSILQKRILGLVIIFTILVLLGGLMNAIYGILIWVVLGLAVHLLIST